MRPWNDKTIKVIYVSTDYLKLEHRKFSIGGLLRRCVVLTINSWYESFELYLLLNFDICRQNFFRETNENLKELDVDDHYTQLIERENDIVFFSLPLNLKTERENREWSTSGTTFSWELKSETYEFYENVKNLL